MGSRGGLRRALIGTIWAPCVLCGCTVGPDYVKPTVATPAAYKEAQPGSDVWKVATPSDTLKRSKW
ncbi:MAG TPA: RND transporter, partial [Burkholderiales bacterium]|nr:RND transporter [Burkholderiales bacterium]